MVNVPNSEIFVGNKTEQIDIIAIEIVDDLTFSNDFSPEISRKFDQIYSEVKEMLMELIKD